MQSGLSTRWRSSRTSTKGSLSLLERVLQARDDHARHAGPRRRKRSEDLLADRLDVIQKRGDRAEQQRGVVVALVERQPRRRPAVFVGPVREDRRLAVARGRNQQEHRCIAGAGQLRDQSVTANQPRPRRAPLAGRTAGTTGEMLVPGISAPHPRPHPWTRVRWGLRSVNCCADRRTSCFRAGNAPTYA